MSQIANLLQGVSIVSGRLRHCFDLRNFYSRRFPSRPQSSTRTCPRLSFDTRGLRFPQGFTAVHLGSIVATLWVLLLNGLVGYQLLDDGTPISLGLILFSAVAFFVGTGYIALDTAFGYTATFVSSTQPPDNRSIGLYVLYQLWPLICVVFFFVLEAILVLRILGEKKPMRSFNALESRTRANPM